MYVDYIGSAARLVRGSLWVLSGTVQLHSAGTITQRNSRLLCLSYCAQTLRCGSILLLREGTYIFN